MASVNRVTLIGNCGADPKVIYMNNGDAVCNFSVACTESWKDKNSGEKKEATEWVRIVMYRKLAEIAGQYLKKGSQVYLEGKLKTRKWTDKDGVERYTTEVDCTEMQMLGSRGPQQENQDAESPRKTAGKPSAHPAGSFDDVGDDSIPF